MSRSICTSFPLVVAGRPKMAATSSTVGVSIPHGKIKELRVVDQNPIRGKMMSKLWEISIVDSMIIW